MSRGIHTVIRVTIAAGTGICGIPFRHTGGGGDRGFVGVRKLRDLFGFNVSAMLAVSFALTELCAGGSFELIPFPKLMGNSIYVITYVRVTAFATDVGSIAPFRTGRRCYDSFVGMAQHTDDLGLKVIAISAIASLFAV